MPKSPFAVGAIGEVVIAASPLAWSTEQEDSSVGSVSLSANAVLQQVDSAH
jgi:hypothetical protein